MDRTGQQIYEYFGALVDERTASRPTTCCRRFVAAEIDGERLTKDDILDICFLMLIAGLDTVSDSLTCMFAYLAQHPEQRHQIVERSELHPARGRGAAPLGDARPAHRHRGWRRRTPSCRTAARSRRATRCWW